MYVPITSRFSTRIAQNGMKIFYFLFLRDRSVECVINDCGRKFFSKTSLKYHHKHYHNTPKKEVDIMSLATNELTG